MAHKNYTNYSKPESQATSESVIKSEVIVTSELATSESQSESEVIMTSEAIVEPVVTEEVTVGVVVDCEELRVRKSPSKLATILCKIPVASEVKIDLTKSTADFYKVYTSTGVEGYCMKQFVAVV